MKNNLLVLALLLIALPGKSRIQIDSLKTVFYSLSEPYENRHQAGIDIITFYLGVQLDSALDIAEVFVDQAEVSGDKKSVVEAYQLYGKAAFFNRKSLAAFEYLDRSLILAKELADPVAIAHSHNLLGMVAAEIADYDEALLHFQTTYQLSVEKQDTNLMMISLNNLANLHTRLGHKEVAKEYFQKFLDLTELTNNAHYSAAGNLNMAILLRQMGEYDRAIDGLTKALLFFEEQGSTMNKALATSNLGEAYREKGDLVLALHFERLSHNLFHEVNSSLGVMNSTSNLGNTFLKLGEEDSARYYLNETWELSLNADDVEGMMSSSKDLFKFYDQIQEVEKADFFKEQFLKYEDSIKGLEVQQNMMESHLQFELQKQRKADGLLSQNRQLEKDNLAGAFYNSKRIWLWIGGGLLIALGLVIYFFSVIKKNKREQKALQAQIQLMAKTTNSGTEETPSQAGFERRIVMDRVDFKLNETDWAILETLFISPHFTNRELAEAISMSYEGVRSSLKKMYRCFLIEKTNGSQKVALVVKVIELSKA